ncbi:MAG TPA: class I SAM-dependent methyltransferase family protein [Lacipirellulaceae bacterium]|nr:class I SAM-dependent methyltransferase family protein [Lacipirellulaceae bacterium]
MKLRQRLRRIRSRSWTGWPTEAYAENRYQQRLEAVQQHLIDCLDNAPRGPIRLISICAGDGRDVIGVLPSHERRNDLSAWLVELDCQSVAAGIRDAAVAGLQNSVRFFNRDATEYATYQGIAPADIVFACGVWGHVPAHERASLAEALAGLCKPRGTVTWTRGISNGTARLGEIEALFVRPTWERLRITRTDDKKWAVATYRCDGQSRLLPRTGRIFNFERHAGR